MSALVTMDGMQERTLLISGFSQAFAMTSWRFGYACGPKKMMKQANKLHQYALMCALTTAQYAAVEAMENGDGDVEAMRSEYDIRRRYSGQAVRGLNALSPKGLSMSFPRLR